MVEPDYHRAANPPEVSAVSVQLQILWVEEQILGDSEALAQRLVVVDADLEADWDP